MPAKTVWVMRPLLVALDCTGRRTFSFSSPPKGSPCMTARGEGRGVSD